MKKILFLACVFLSMHSFAQQPVFEWAKQQSGIGEDIGQSITTDDVGNVYVVGSFQDTVDFDPGPEVYSLSVIGETDMFISKLDVNGDLLWALSVGGDEVRGYEIDTDILGNVYVVGKFHGTIDFDPGPDTFYLSNGSEDIFILKLTSEGSFAWAKNIGGAGWGLTVDIVVDSNGNVYTTGNFNDVLDFDPGPDVVNLGANNDESSFILKLNSDGDFVWAKTVGGDETVSKALSIDSFNNIYSTGYYIGSVDFDPNDEEYYLSAGNDVNMFLLKLSSSGDFLWAKRFDTDTQPNDAFVDPEIFGFGITTDNNGYIYLTGKLVGALDGFNDISSGYSDDSDAFILKLDAGGDIIWGASFGGPSNDAGSDVIIDETGNVYLSGSFRGNVDFDPGPDDFYLNENGYSSNFILKLNSDGLFTWGSSFAGSFWSITLDKWDNLYTTGWFDETVDFDLGFGIYELTSENHSRDIFIHKMNQEPCSAIPAIISSNPDFTFCNGDTIDLSLNALMPFWITNFSYSWNTGETTDTIIVAPDSTSTYEVFVNYTYDNIVCAASNSLEIILFQDTIEVPYNGIDDDCNETTLDDDLDQDGFLLADDCDDNNPLVNPDATEIPFNDIDDDCNPETLDQDADQDGFIFTDDCDDTNPQINPDVSEIPYNGIDDDCNELTLDDDLDQDGFLLVDDCDDENPSINTAAEEIPNNGIDEDCDGEDLIIIGTNNILTIQPQIFPNPTTSEFQIIFPNSIQGTYELRTISGKLIYQGKLHQQTTVNLERQTEGIYILLMKTDKGVWAERVVKL